MGDRPARGVADNDGEDREVPAEAVETRLAGVGEAISMRKAEPGPNIERGLSPINVIEGGGADKEGIRVARVEAAAQGSHRLNVMVRPADVIERHAEPEGERGFKAGAAEGVDRGADVKAKRGGAAAAKKEGE